jgi:hypothetical protein
LQSTQSIHESAASCDLLAHGSVRVRPAELGNLRQKPGPAPAERLSPTLLKNADDQTVVGMAAVLQAIHEHNLSVMRFTEWGVLAAPRFLGRVIMSAARQRYLSEGAWGISPHLIPHRCLHSISGTVSQALKIHGPNLGIGGGPGGVLEALRCATAMLHGDKLPGVWVVLTGWDPEPVPDDTGITPPDTQCLGLALALTTARTGWRGPRLRLIPPEDTLTENAKAGKEPTHKLLTLERLTKALAVPEAKAAAVVWQLDDGGRLELERAGANLGLAGPHAWGLATGRVIVGSSGAGAENSL